MFSYAFVWFLYVFFSFYVFYIVFMRFCIALKCFGKVFKCWRICCYYFYIFLFRFICLSGCYMFFNCFYMFLYCLCMVLYVFVLFLFVSTWFCFVPPSRHQLFSNLAKSLQLKRRGSIQVHRALDGITTDHTSSRIQGSNAGDGICATSSVLPAPPGPQSSIRLGSTNVIVPSPWSRLWLRTCRMLSMASAANAKKLFCSAFMPMRFFWRPASLSTSALTNSKGDTSRPEAI